MTGELRRYVGIVLLVVALVVLAVLGSRGGFAGSGDLWPPEFSVDRIAVVGPDAQIRSYRPDGSGERLISQGEGFFTWPTWSPDGRSIVFSGVVRDPAGEPIAKLFSYDGATGVSSTVHQGSPGFPGLLADGVVHYPLWSPDSSKLAFVAVTREHGLSLYLDDVHADQDPEFVLDRGPLWMSWSADSSTLAVHRARDHFLVSVADGLLLERIGLDSDSYRVPAWRPGEPELTLLRQTGGSAYGLYLAPVTPAGIVVRPPISDAGLGAAFLWSSSGAHLAVADNVTPIRYRGKIMYVYRQLRVLDAASFGQAASVSDNVLAYFWSPDGSKIAYAVLADVHGAMRWTILDVSTGVTSELVGFIPSADQLTMFQFFDQYAYSHRVWSPDSRYLVFAGRLSEEADTVGINAQPRGRSSQIYIIDTGPARSVKTVADGVLGFWSPI